jgi:hypothetical protein
MAIKHTNMFHCKTLFTQIGIFGLKKCHPATLHGRVLKVG